MRRRGFTLIEVLVVIEVLAILSVIVIIAINPLRQFAQARNAQRKMDIKQITEAISQYAVDHRGSIPPGIDQNLRMIGTATSGCAVVCGQSLAVVDSSALLTRQFADALGGIPVAQAAGGGSSSTSNFLFLVADAQPRKVVPGDTMTLTATLQNTSNIVSVTAQMGNIDTVNLAMASGTAQNGSWTGVWHVHDTIAGNYIVTMTATDVNGDMVTQTVPWSDPAASGWISPSSVSTPGGQWTNPGNAIDGNIVTYTSNQYGGTGYGQYIVFSLATSTLSNRFRINTDYTNAVINSVEVDVFNASGTWVNVFTGGNEATWNDQTVEVSFPAQMITQARFRYNYAAGGYNFWLYEFQLYQATGAVVAPTCSTTAADLIQDITATMHGAVSDDGGEPDTYQFEYGPSISYGTSTGWSTSDVASGDALNQAVTGLTPSTLYHFCADVRNSAGTTHCGDMTFTTLAPIVGWVSPSGYLDPDVAWVNGINATDQNLGSYASSYHAINATQWSSYLYLTHSSMAINKIRFYGRGGSEVSQAEVDLLVNGVWQNVFSGAFADQSWVEVAFPQMTMAQARIRFFATAANTGFNFELFEFQFQKSSEGSSDACLDLSGLVPTYIVKIPVDPQTGSTPQTYYAVKQSANGRVTMYACSAELSATITGTR